MATVFLGSGLLYIAMVFTSAALAGGLIGALINAHKILTQQGTYALGRAEIFQTMNVYGIKMAGVFMFSTSTILRRTSIVPRWIAFLGYGLGAALLLAIGFIRWIPLVFPIWVLLISVAILLKIQFWVNSKDYFHDVHDDLFCFDSIEVIAASEGQGFVGEASLLLCHGIEVFVDQTPIPTPFSSIVLQFTENGSEEDGYLLWNAYVR